MLTVSEAMQRARVNNVRIKRSGNHDWCVTLNEWDKATCDKAGYYTDDLEDAVLTGAAMRSRNNRV